MRQNQIPVGGNPTKKFSKMAFDLSTPLLILLFAAWESRKRGDSLLPSLQHVRTLSIEGIVCTVLFDKHVLLTRHSLSHTQHTAVRTLLLPLSVQQSKNTEYMKALKPYMNEIKEKFPDNEEMRNRVTAKLFEDANQNPLAGCLTSLAQLPIFLGLYRGVRLLAIDGQLNEPFLWIPSLEGPVGPPDYRGMQWLTEGWTPPVDGGLPTPSLGWETTLAFLVMPVILVLGQKLTMEVLQPTDLEDESSMSAKEKEEADRTKTIFKFLPLLIGFFSLQVPAGLTIYWFTSNIFTLTQSLVVRQYYKVNPPDIDLPEYWDSLDNLEEMTAEEKRKAAEAGLNAGPTFTDLKDGTLPVMCLCIVVLCGVKQCSPYAFFFLQNPSFTMWFREVHFVLIARRGSVLILIRTRFRRKWRPGSELPGMAALHQKL